MKLHSLKKTVHRSKKRLGRGHGSGRGKTAGRGTKGQKARGTIPPHFEGGQLSIMKRLPLLRGKSRNRSQKVKPVVISVGKLNALPAKSTVTIATLIKAGLVDQKTTSVKILSGGKLDHALTVSVACSDTARNVIEKAGGTVGV